MIPDLYIRCSDNMFFCYMMDNDGGQEVMLGQGNSKEEAIKNSITFLINAIVAVNNLII